MMVGYGLVVLFSGENDEAVMGTGKVRHDGQWCAKPALEHVVRPGFCVWEKRKRRLPCEIRLGVSWSD